DAAGQQRPPSMRPRQGEVRAINGFLRKFHVVSRHVFAGADLRRSAATGSCPLPCLPGDTRDAQIPLSGAAVVGAVSAGAVVTGAGAGRGTSPRPSSLTALTQAAAGRPSRIGRPVTVTLSPGRKSFFLMPLRNRVLGPSASKPQSVVVWSSLVT